MSQSSQRPANFGDTVIAVAGIAADQLVVMHKVMHIAWSVSIAAKNAMIISTQADTKALGFQPITRFIDEIARTTMESAKHIETESVYITRLSAIFLRTWDVFTRLSKVDQIAKNAKYHNTFASALEGSSKKLEDESNHLSRELHKLGSNMQDLEQQMRSALAVASFCRIEASCAGEYRNSLSVVADDLEKAALEIKRLIQEGRMKITAIRL